MYCVDLCNPMSFTTHRFNKVCPEAQISIVCTRTVSRFLVIVSYQCKVVHAASTHCKKHFIIMIFSCKSTFFRLQKHPSEETHQPYTLRHSKSAFFDIQQSSPCSLTSNTLDGKGSCQWTLRRASAASTWGLP
jgi:hypothetical protein